MGLFDSNVNETAVACTRIQQREETKRTRLKEKEETRRVALRERDTPGYIFPRVCFLIVTGLLIFMWWWGKHPDKPTPPRYCIESAEIISPENKQRDCFGGTITTEPMPRGPADHIIVKCKCPKHTEDAGP